jgi:DNA primase
MQGGNGKPGQQQQQQQYRKPQQQMPQQQQRPEQRQERPEQRPDPRQEQRPQQQPAGKPKEATPQEREIFEERLEDLIGTRGAYILDEKLSILGKVPLSELQGTLKSLKSGIYAVILDGVIDKDLVAAAERAYVSFLVAMDTKIKSTGRLTILTSDEL